MEWKLRKFKLKDLKDYSKNPRRLTEQQFAHLKTSIDKFGLIDKPVVTPDGQIIGGHQRKQVLAKLGMKEVECWVSDSTEWDDGQISELNIRLNRNHGEWDLDMLANHFEEGSLIEWGFEAEEIPGWEKIEDKDAEEDSDGQLLSPGLDENAITQLGDIYELGNGHRLVCGDCTIPATVDKCMKGHEAVLMVTDPPYGVEYDGDWRSKISKKKGKYASGKVKNDDQVSWDLAWSLFPGNVAYIWHASTFTALTQKSLQNAEYETICQIIWAKQHFALSRGDYHWQHEPCWYAVRKGANHNWQGARDQSTIWNIANLNPFGRSSDKGEERTSHSTQKPVACMAIPIKNNSAPGDGVYDPFMGSGTTLIAAEQLNRICYGIELSPAYCDIIVQRYVNWMKKNSQDINIKRNGEIEKRFK